MLPPLVVRRIRRRNAAWNMCRHKVPYRDTVKAPLTLRKPCQGRGIKAGISRIGQYAKRGCN